LVFKAQLRRENEGPMGVMGGIAEGQLAMKVED